MDYHSDNYPVARQTTTLLPTRDFYVRIMEKEGSVKMDYIHDLRKIIGPRKIILNCAGALIIRDNKILFQRRTDNGKWGLIGGLLEMNETYEEAALREIREETGLEVRLDSFLGIFHNHNMVWSNGDAAHVISAIFIVSSEKTSSQRSSLRIISRR